MKSIPLILLVVSTVSAQKDLELLVKLLPPSNTRITGRINVHDKSWEEWQKRTGEMPPDFSRMRSLPLLPDPLEGVRSIADWSKRRALIRSQLEKWVTGTMPPSPQNLRAIVTKETSEGDLTVRDVRLEFGPDHKATLRVQLLIPRGKGPFPVFLTNHPRNRPWVATAVRRGYMGVIYFATDPAYGNGDDSDKFLEVYPDYDFSCLGRWAWAASRAVDYLFTLPEVNRGQIAISGHSRNGKQALMAAAFDERIGAIALSSGNTGEGNPWRYTTDPFAAESMEQITGNFPHWFHPRLRFFVGREDKLPVDQNSMMALLAPRGLLIASAFSEAQGNAFGHEQAYRSARKVFSFLGKPDNIGLSIRAGEHATTAADIEAYFDFFDGVFGRKPNRKFENFVHGYDFEDWKKITGTISAPSVKGSKIQWALGEEPPSVPFPAATKIGPAGMTDEGWLGMLYKRPLASSKMRTAAVSFGDDLKADLYLPPNGQTTGKLPVVIWLHAFSYATGYSQYARLPFEELTGRGYAVLAFDQIGFGTRGEHAREFYTRYPNWSLLGKMVADTRAAISAVAALEEIDASQIFLVGYSLGGKVAVWTAALDVRVKAIVSIAGITPLRETLADGPLEGIRQYSHLHGLLPRFGFFVNSPRSLPVDYDDLLRAAARRRVLLVAPELDRYADTPAIRTMVQGMNHVSLETPEDFSRVPASTRKLAFDWLDKVR